jgi:hypothetical protein
MFPTGFSFAAALLALPLAGAPILLHLLFRQKSPVIPFSTLRFIKLSVRQTAARRKVQKWLLLATRAFLIALLIFAIAQPFRQLTSSWSGGTGRSLVAAVVIDTSYSMQIKEGQITEQARAESIVQDLLRDQLAGGKVAIFTSRADPKNAEQARDPEAILAGWTPLQPQAESRPMSDRISSAEHFLENQTADSKWLIVLSDFQSSEFPHEIADVPGGRVILFDLRPTDARSDGIKQITITPSQPIPGVPAEVAVQAIGHPGDERTVSLSVDDPQGGEGAHLVQSGEPVQLKLDSGGLATAGFKLRLPAKRWLLLTGSFTAADDMPWDDTRSQLIEVPPKQNVAVIWPGASPETKRFVGAALDPYDAGTVERENWPISPHVESGPTAGDDAAVVVLSEWPSANQAQTLSSFVSQGHNLVLYLTPGLESTWAGAPPAVQKAMEDLLPSAPVKPVTGGPWHAAVAGLNEPLLNGLTDDRYQLGSVTVRQSVSLSAVGNAIAILNAVPTDPANGATPQGLLFRKPVGRGICYTVATIPDSRTNNVGTEPLFPILLVKMVLPNPGQSTAQNVDVGEPLVLSADKFPGVPKLEIQTPHNDQTRRPQPGDDDQRPAARVRKRTQIPTPVRLRPARPQHGDRDLDCRAERAREGDRHAAAAVVATAGDRAAADVLRGNDGKRHEIVEAPGTVGRGGVTPQQVELAADLCGDPLPPVRFEIKFVRRKKPRQQAARAFAPSQGSQDPACRIR